MMTEQRNSKFLRVAACRQNMTVILENVHDPHNIGAVLRTCDAVGIQEIYILYTDERLSKENLLKFKVSSTGVKKWMHIHYFDNNAECFNAVKSKYDLILATHLNQESHAIHQIDLTRNIAFSFWK